MPRKREKTKKRHSLKITNTKDISKIFLRYIILILISIPNLWIFYKVFTPLTAYPVYWLLSISYDTSIIGTSIILINRSIPIELINACIAGSAYYLLTILNLSIPKINIKKRLIMLLSSFAVFLIVNILRIYLLSNMAITGSNLFDITHILFWYSVSLILIVLIWFSEVKIFKIKDIPFYSDIKFLYKHTK